VAASTGPILAAGGIVIFNAVIVHAEPPASQNRVVVATLIAAGGLALLEAGFPSTAVAIAWTALIATLIVRAEPNTPSPVESFQKWINTK
jgi:hypothetical protein